MESWSLHILSRPTMLWWVALVVGVGIAVWTYYRLRAPITPGWVAILRALRIVALLLVLIPLLEPVLSLVGSISGPAPLLVLVDASGSMGLRAGSEDSEADTTSRFEAGRRLLASMESSWGSDFQLQVASFSGRLQMHGRRDSLPAAPLGPSALGEALEQSLTGPSPGAASGIVLLSDGVSTVGKDPVVVARNSPVPIYTVCLGDTVAPRDLLIRQVQTNPEVTLGEPLPIQVTLEAWGQKGERVDIEVLDGPEVVASQRVEIQGEVGEAQDIRLSVRPRASGLVLYRVRARLEGEEDPIPINNERLVAVEVRERARRVLVIDPNPAWDFTFLKRALEADSSLVPTFLIQDQVDRWSVLGDPVIGGWPQGRSEWRQWSAVILSGSAGVAPHADQLRRFAEGGGGLFFLHGTRGWEGLRGGPLADLLPVRAAGRRPVRGSALGVDLTEAGQVDPLTLISDSPYRNATLWAGLPPIWPGPVQMRAKAAARVLLCWKSDAREPAFAVAGYGKGRVAALCGQGFWRWIFLPRSVPGGAEVAEPFFRQVVHWLMEPSTQDRFRVVSVRKVFQNGERVEFEGRFRDESYEPLAGARTELRIASEDGGIVRRVQMIPTAREGEYQGGLEPLPPGAYTFEAHITTPEGGKELREGRFWVEEAGAEIYRTWSDPRTLRLISEVSGGGVGDPRELPALKSLVQKTHRRSRQVRQAELWNHWILFAAFVLFLGTEWFLRRRRGLA